MPRLALVLLFAVVLRLPFLNQAIQGDDHNYLESAAYAQVDPLHPNHVRFVFLGSLIDMRGHPHPPLNSAILGLLVWILGGVREIPFHAAYLLFTLLAAVSMWALAERFSPRPLLASLLFLAVPPFVVMGTSLESDLPFLSFWMASLALFFRAVEKRSVATLAACAVMQTCAALAAYQAVILVPLLGLFLWLHDRTWRSAWPVVFVTPAVLLAWLAFERLSSGAVPLEVMGGYFQSYGLQRLTNKLNNAAALTVHAGWIIGPVLTALAFLRTTRWLAIPALSAIAGGLWIDPNPAFWLSFALGITLLLWCALHWRDYLAAWILLFFGAALVLFFAGSARYLLPMAAPVAILATRQLANRPGWLWAGLLVNLACSLALAVANYDHWDAYRRFIAAQSKTWENHRVWINGEWGLRFYAEEHGAAPIERGQPVRPGDILISSRLAMPVPFNVGGGTLTTLAEEAVVPRLPLRTIALDTRSAFSVATKGLRPFGLSNAPLDVVSATQVVERLPALSYVAMNDPQAPAHIVSGIDALEGGFRWTGKRAVLLLKPPAAAAPIAVTFAIHEKSPARSVRLTLDGRLLKEEHYAAPGAYTLVTEPVVSTPPAATLTIEIDQTFSVPGDQRQLGLILLGAGFSK